MRILLTIIGILLLAAGAIPGAGGVLGFGFSILYHDPSYIGPSALGLLVGMIACGAGLALVMHNILRMSFNSAKVFVGGFFLLGAAFFSWVFLISQSWLFAALAIGFAAAALSYIRQRQEPPAELEKILAA